MGISPDSIEAVRRAADLADLVSRTVPLTGRGKDLFGVCPFHSDKDPSFSVNTAKGFFYCFGCGAKGDVIDWVMRTQGISFADAVKHLAAECGVMLAEDTGPAGPAAYELPKTKQGSRIRGVEGSSAAPAAPDPEFPPAIWREKAAAFVQACHERLMASKPALKKLEKTRGIRPETGARFLLGMNPEGYWRPRKSWGLPNVEGRDGKVFRNFKIDRGMVIPNILWSGELDRPQDIVVNRIRIRRPAGAPKYKLVPGSYTGPMIIMPPVGATPCGRPNAGRPQGIGQAQGPAPTVLVVESELCAMLCAQEVGDLAAVIAMGSALAKPDAAARRILDAAHVILNALDFDAAGASALGNWRRWYPHMIRWPVPEGKDPTDAFLAGVDLSAWVTAGIPGAGASGPSLLSRKVWGEGEDDEGSRGRGAKGPSEERGPRVRGVNGSSDVVYKGTACGPTGTPDPGGNGLREKLQRLAGLLKGAPVVILNTETRLSIKYPKSWPAAHGDTFRQISDLVYLDREVFDFIIRHPHAQITAENLI